MNVSNSNVSSNNEGVVQAFARLVRRTLATYRARASADRAYVLNALVPGANKPRNTARLRHHDALDHADAGVTNPRLFLRTLAADGRATRRVRAISEPIPAGANVILLDRRRRVRAE